MTILDALKTPYTWLSIIAAFAIVILIQLSFAEPAIWTFLGDGTGPSILLLIGSVVFGILLVAIGYKEIEKNPDMAPRLYQVVRMVIAFGGGFMAAGILGGIEISGNWPTVAVKATGPFGAVVLFYALNPK